MIKKITNTVKQATSFMGLWTLGEHPISIEQQELNGQQELVVSAQLPTKLNTHSKMSDSAEVYSKLGITVIKKTDNDELFYDVKLPHKWSIQPTEHAMWSNLIDDKNRIRANIFYKAAFYDRDAFINMQQFYNIDLEILRNEASSSDANPWDKPRIIKITDANGKVIRFEYDKNNNLVKVTDRLGNSISYSFL
jgi:YD repeat-containing protein